MADLRLEWGTGPRLAALVHGYSDDADTWHAVGPRLAECGFRVVAVDQLGHGLAPRRPSYDLDLLFADLSESLPQGIDLLIGHSMGAIVANHAAVALQPKQVVLVDPLWMRMLPERRPSPAPKQDVNAPNWSAEDIRVDLQSTQRLDPVFAAYAASDEIAAMDMPVQPPAAPTTVIVPETDSLVPVERRPALEAMGFEFVTVPDVGHVIFRDDLDAFMTALTGVIATPVAG